MDPAAIEQLRLEVVQEWGPWTGFNMRLADGVYTIAPQRLGNAELRVAQVAQIVSDMCGGTFENVRVLDLGSHEGGFGIELALRGAEVVCVEARDAHVAKSEFAKRCLGLDEQLEIVQSDVRHVDAATLGKFDVVLCLGLLYHLPAAALGTFVRSLAAMCSRLCVIETQIALRDRRSFEYGGQRFSGRTYGENPAHLGAAVDAEDAFWLTRPSLINLLSDAGFTSVTEVLNPLVPEIAAFEDHATFVALRGEPIALLSVPELAEMAHQRWPEHLPARRHPIHERFGSWPILGRLARRRLMRTIRGKEHVQTGAARLTAPDDSRRGR